MNVSAKVNSSGKLILTIDGKEIVAGLVRGPMGGTGLRGKSGDAVKGDKGDSGNDGKNGTNGIDGVNGVGIKTITSDPESPAEQVRMLIHLDDGRVYRTPNLKGAPGEPGMTGLAGTRGHRGLAGYGVPAGGTTGQVLSKINGTDYNTQWIASGAGAGTVTSV